MKKLYSLIKATMTSDMNIFKIKQKKITKRVVYYYHLHYLYVLCFVSGHMLI